MKGFYIRPLKRNKKNKLVADIKKVLGVVAAETEQEALKKVAEHFKGKIGFPPFDCIVVKVEGIDTKAIATVDPEPIELFIQ